MCPLMLLLPIYLHVNKKSGDDDDDDDCLKIQTFTMYSNSFDNLGTSCKLNELIT